MSGIMTFDKRSDASGLNLSGTSVVILLGLTAKNDGGGGRYERVVLPLPTSFNYPFFTSTDGGGSTWGLVPENGVVNPLQFGAKGNNNADDRVPLQDCIDYINYWNTVHGNDTTGTATKLVLPANYTFLVDGRSSTSTPTVQSAFGLTLKGPITIEGESADRSVIKFKENTKEGDSPLACAPLFLADTLTDVVLSNFRIEGNYTGKVGDHGLVNLFLFKNLTDVSFERVTFAHNRAVIISGDGIKNLTMRNCLLSESRRGGLVITDADRVVIEDNDFRWVADDPVAITWTGASGSQESLKTGGAIRITGNRCFGCRGINVAGAKNVLIADNSHVLGRGRAIHVGTTTFQQKGDTSTLNVVIRNNIVTDLLDATVDPSLDQENGGHRAIDVELLYAAAGPLPASPGVAAPFPGLPDPAGVFVDPATYYYTTGQGRQRGKVWVASQSAAAGDLLWWLGNLYEVQSGTTTTGSAAPVHTVLGQIVNGLKFLSGEPTPQSGTFLVEGNIISRTRMPTSDFETYGVGKFGGVIGYNDGTSPVGPIDITMADLTPSEGISVSGAAHAITVRGNQIRNCDKSVSLQGPGATVPLPFYLQDVVIIDNDIADWISAAVFCADYDAGQRQRVMVLGNRADGDPLHKSSLRSAGRNGTWGQGGPGTFVNPSPISFLVIAGNHVRNVSKLVGNLPDANQYPQPHVMQDNVGYCNPVAAGYNAANAGIGTIIEPARGWRYVIEGSNPSQPDYGALLNSCPLAVRLANGKSAPEGNGWVEGTFVRNLAPLPITVASVGTYEVSGWRRVTTGTANVLNTDWKEQRIFTA